MARILLFLSLFGLLLFIGVTSFAPFTSRLNDQLYPKTLTHAASSSFSLGIRIDPSLTSWYNIHALPTDVAYSFNLSYLNGVKVNNKGLELYGNGSTAVNSAIQSLSGTNVKILMYDDEVALPCSDNTGKPSLLGDEQYAKSKTKLAGLTLGWSPTGFKVDYCYTHDKIALDTMVSSADIMFYQVEYFQPTTLQSIDPGSFKTFSTKVKNMVSYFKSVHPGIPVWVQVSVDPQSNNQLQLPLQSVLDSINSLEDGQGNNPDEIQVYFAGINKIPLAYKEMEQVIEYYRSQGITPTQILTPTPSPTPTVTPIPSDTPTPIDTPSPTPTVTPIPSDTPTPTPINIPTKPIITLNSNISCFYSSNQIDYLFTISWSSINPPVSFIDISLNDPEFNNYYHKGFERITTHISGPSGFNGFQGVNGSMPLFPNTTYDVRLFNGNHSDTSTFKTPSAKSC